MRIKLKTNIIENYKKNGGIYTKIPLKLTIDGNLYRHVLTKLAGKTPMWVRHRELTCMKDELDDFKNELLGENQYGVIRFAYREPYYSGDMALIGVYYLESDDFTNYGVYRQISDWRKTFSAPAEAVCWNMENKIYSNVQLI
jgi:hypothetical protein